MDLKFIKDEDIDVAYQGFVDRGTPEAELEDATVGYLEELNYERSKEKGPPIYFKGALSAIPRTMSDKAVGATVFTPEDMPFEENIDKGLLKVSKLAEKMINPNWERQTAEVASGTLNPFKEGGVSTWAAIMGNQMPIQADMLISRSIGKLIGAPIGAGIAAIGGAAVPAPEEVATVPAGAVAGATVGALLVPLASLSLTEAGAFMRQAKMLGIDEDIAAQMAPSVGVINGAIEEVQQLTRIAPFLRGKAKDKVASVPIAGSMT